MVSEFGYYQLVNEVTTFNGTLIDHIYTNVMESPKSFMLVYWKHILVITNIFELQLNTKINCINQISVTF